MLVLGWFAKPFRNIFAKMGLRRVAAALALVPKDALKLKVLKPRSAFDPRAPRAEAAWPSCWVVCRRSWHRRSIGRRFRLLRRHGLDVMVIKDEGSCWRDSALSWGASRRRRRQARHNIDALTAVMRERLLDGIVVTDGSRGAMLKHYGNICWRATVVTPSVPSMSQSLARDVTEFLHEIDLNPPVMWTGLKVADHSSCSSQHGQESETLPRTLLEQAGYTLTDIPEAHLCCGSAGVFNILQPELSGQLRDRILKNIESIEPDVVVVGNVGSMILLQGGIDVPIVHTVELLDWATGGPCPPALSKMKHAARHIEALVEMAKAAAKERELVD